MCVVVEVAAFISKAAAASFVCCKCVQTECYSADIPRDPYEGFS